MPNKNWKKMSRYMEGPEGGRFFNPRKPDLKDQQIENCNPKRKKKHD